MKELVWLQLVVIGVSWFITLFFFGGPVSTSVLVGGLTYFLPTLLSVIVLTNIRGMSELLPMMLLIVEFYKILLAAVIIIAVCFFYPGVNRIGYVIGLILVAQTGFLMFRKSSYE